MYLRTVKVPSSNGNVNEYVRVVEAYRDDGKVKQRVVADLGRKDLLAAMLPNLQRLLNGTAADDTTASDPAVLDASTWGPILALRALFEHLGLWSIFEEFLGRAKGVSFVDRAFVLIANRLIHPASEHALAGWLETDFVCTRDGRRFVPNWHQRRRVRVHSQQLDAWYRTLDQLLRAKEQIEVALYHRLKDLFSIRPDLVFYDITSTYFEGAGPEGFARHGHSRDGKSQNVQVVVGMVMVAGWPIAHHVFAGNRVDHSTVQEVVADLQKRFDFERVVFVGDRGMVTEENLEALTKEGHGYLVGVKRRRNAKLQEWLLAAKPSKWIDCPVGIAAGERKQDPPRTRAQEVPSGIPGVRVIVIDSDERRAYEQAQRTRSMERTRLQLERLQKRVAVGRLKQPEKIGAAVERILQRHHGHRYYAWQLDKGALKFFDSPNLDREKQLEGKYVLSTTEPKAKLTLLDAVARYKELNDVEQGFRQLKDVMALRPIYHQTEPRVNAHIFVAALALLVQRLLVTQLREAEIDFTAQRALQALSTIRLVRFRIDDQQTRRGISGGSPDARRILKALGIADLRPPTPPESEETVM